MKIEIDRSGNVSLKLHRPDCAFVGLADDEVWLPALVGVRVFGDRVALKVEFDLRDLYRGSDGAFYVVPRLGADEVRFDELTLRRVHALTKERGGA